MPTNDSPITHRIAIKRVARRLRRHSGARRYADVKLRFDPAYQAVADTLQGTPLPVLDIGCGMGLLGMYLHERGVCHGYLGIDTDARKLRDGNAALAEARRTLHLRECDACAPPSHQGHVVLLDVLHYMPFDAQRRVLQQAAQRVAPTGMLLVRTCLAEPNWRFRATVAEEWLLHASGWMQHDGTHTIPRREQIEEPLREQGLHAMSLPLWGVTPYNSWLFVARHEQRGQRDADQSYLQNPAACVGAGDRGVIRNGASHAPR